MISLEICYDGTPFLGWQKTKMGPSIQEALEKALLAITQESPLVQAASRTDRGVHAEGQVVAFSLSKTWDLPTLTRALHARLPPTIRIRKALYRHASFHPTLEAVCKTYSYQLYLAPVQLPQERLYSWHLYHPLRLDLMQESAHLLLGEHDFSAFTNRPYENPLCHLFQLEVSPPLEGMAKISCRGNRFLYKMVRNLVGTLVYIGLGKIPPSSLPSLLASKDRRKTGITAPAHGLFLEGVEYGAQ